LSCHFSGTIYFDSLRYDVGLQGLQGSACRKPDHGELPPSFLVIDPSSQRAARSASVMPYARPATIVPRFQIGEPSTTRGRLQPMPLREAARVLALMLS
jgi:hypothetical protein